MCMTYVSHPTEKRKVRWPSYLSLEGKCSWDIDLSLFLTFHLFSSQSHIFHGCSTSLSCNSLAKHFSLPWSLQHYSFRLSLPILRETCSRPFARKKMQSPQQCVGKLCQICHFDSLIQHNAQRGRTRILRWQKNSWTCCNRPCITISSRKVQMKVCLLLILLS